MHEPLHPSNGDHDWADGADRPADDRSQSREQPWKMTSIQSWSTDSFLALSIPADFALDQSPGNDATAWFSADRNTGVIVRVLPPGTPTYDALPLDDKVDQFGGKAILSERREFRGADGALRETLQFEAAFGGIHHYENGGIVRGTSSDFLVKVVHCRMMGVPTEADRRLVDRIWEEIELVAP